MERQDVAVSGGTAVSYGQVQEAEAEGKVSAECLLERSKFVQRISELNAVANTERKGRTDLSADILGEALKFWRGSDRPSIELPISRTNESRSAHESFGKVASNTSTTSGTSSLGSVKDKVFGILRSVTNSTKNIHTSSKVVRFFHEEDDGVDNASNASTASTDYKSSGDVSLVDKDICAATSGKAEKQESAGDTCVAQCLAGDVVESFWHMRYYLRDISSSLERIDPNLSHNAELASRLEDWEESWEIGRDYVQDAEMYSIICELVSFLKKAEELEPALAEMTQDCGAEFCLCLPRLVWLHFLQDPERQMKLLQRFLPHRFTPDTAASELQWDNGIENLLRQYGAAEHEAVQFSKRHAEKGNCVLRLLVQSVVAGPNSESQPGASIDAHTLVRAIEEHSMELQRRKPEVWNHFMMVIVRCFSDGQPKHRQRMGPKAPVPKLPSRRGQRSLWRSRPRLRTMPHQNLHQTEDAMQE